MKKSTAKILIIGSSVPGIATVLGLGIHKWMSHIALANTAFIALHWPAYLFVAVCLIISVVTANIIKGDK